MIVEKGKYYIYRHITLSGITFYIGRGTKDSKDIKYGLYSRSKSTRNRTSFWKKTANKYGYTVEIILETNNFEFICEKEKEFIKLYGRRKYEKGGTLVNFSEGGEKGNFKAGKSRSRRVYMYDHEGKYIKSFNSLMSASRKFSVNSGTILWCCREKQKLCKGYQFRLFWSDNIGKVEYKVKYNRKVLCTNIVTEETVVYENIKDASNKLGISAKTIGNNLCNLSKTIRRGYKFKYIENE